MDPEYRDRAVYLDGTLVLADLHFGKAEASTVEFPIGAGEDCVDRLEGLLDRFDPDEVVLAGDVFHSFSSVPDSADAALSGIVRAVRDSGARLVVVEGNHDTMLGDAYAGDLRDEYELDTDGDETVVVCHGHEEPETTADAYVVGHDHPAIEIEGQKRPCFLLGDGAYRRSDVLVVPPFNRLVEGLSVNGRVGTSRPELSPMVTRVAQFRPVVFDAESEETLTFPPLGQFSRML
ncbi:metallophosphoesterase [Halosimplex sp. TS25]|uniref:metallophosphoesterase n=1 Tax=Halosimplex rarum TaxID=3396619 RepID=UPI0039EA337A